MLCNGQKKSGVVRNGHQKWLEGVTGDQKWPKMSENGWMWLEVEVSGFGLIQPEIKSDLCRFGFIFSYRLGWILDLRNVTDLGSILMWWQIWIWVLGSFSTTGWVGFWIWEISRVWVWIRVHFLIQVGSVSESIIFDGFGFGFGLKLYYRLGWILDLRNLMDWVWNQVQFQNPFCLTGSDLSFERLSIALRLGQI